MRVEDSFLWKILKKHFANAENSEGSLLRDKQKSDVCFPRQKVIKRVCKT